MRRKTSQQPDWTYKSCAYDTTCVSAHEVCRKLINSSQECHAHCCEGDLCNLMVHKNENIDRHKGNGVSSIPVPLTALVTLTWLMLLHVCGLN